MAPYEAIILGSKVSITHIDGVLSRLKEVMVKNTKLRPFFVVTAYSEFFLEARTNQEFAHAVAKSDLVVADGAVVPAAADYVKRRSINEWRNFWLGMEVGWKLWRGEYVGRVAGVDLIRKLTQPGSGVKKIFLLGGWNGVAGKLAQKFQTINDELQVEFDEGSKDVREVGDDMSGQVIKKINDFKPDVLLVAFGRYKQEMWIAKNLDKIKAKMVMGVGSAFDELVGEGSWARPVPEWVNKHGLKWLWRAINDSSHWPRVWRAAVVFPWKVWRG